MVRSRYQAIVETQKHLQHLLPSKMERDGLTLQISKEGYVCISTSSDKIVLAPSTLPEVYQWLRDLMKEDGL